MRRLLNDVNNVASVIFAGKDSVALVAELRAR